MKCHEFEEKISEYIEGLLGKEEIKSVERHALLCPSCQELLVGVRQTCRALRQLGLEDPIPSFALTIWGRIQETLVKRQQSYRRSLTMGLAMTTALVILLWPAQYPERIDPSYKEDQGITPNRNLGQVWSQRFPEWSRSGPHSHAQIRMASF